MKSNSFKLPRPSERQSLLITTRNLKMARSSHAYVRGNTLKFYEWLGALESGRLPHGPPIWICGDCHMGNLGPLADAKGRIEIQIRDLDQTIVGNPVHDLVRLGLSLASAARGSNLPGVVTAHMIEHMSAGYARAFDDDLRDGRKKDRPASVQVELDRAMNRSWKHLARERIKNPKPTIPLGTKFWPISRAEKHAIEKLCHGEAVRRLATSIRSREDNAHVEVADAAYWVKGCSSLGRLRFAVLLEVSNGGGKGKDYCLMDLKEGTRAAAPHDRDASMPRDNAKRVVAGACHLAPNLGERMLAERLFDRALVIRELRPQDLKLEIDQLSAEEAKKAAYYLANVVGVAHAQQMDAATRKNWLQELRRCHSKSLDAPSWLWSSIVELLVSHEAGYLEHCRRYALDAS